MNTFPLIRRAAICCLFVTASLQFVPLAAGADETAVDFNNDIRPILNKHCTACHGGVRQAADISFIYRDMTLDSGIIVPGQPDESELIARITSDDPDVRMPPPEEHGESLTGDQINLLKRWIADGAEWGTHWSFQQPTDPAVPAVARREWVRRGLDAFVMNRLDAEHLSPSPEATPRAWIRRVSFDLVGLPPTPEQVVSFLSACEQAEGTVELAYAAEVDRLLSSPHFGERWAVLWMDLARYSDSKGFENDSHRDMWPYRDWLIRAFNEDMPFDEFTIKQLAGDLGDHPTADDIVATAFHRNSQTNTEGGTDDEEFRVAAVIDRISSTWTIWQATTFGCVQCHSHPYDPFQHEEFYKFFAIFNSTEDHDLDDDYPTMVLPTDREQAKMALRLDRQSRELRGALNQTGIDLAKQQPQWTVIKPCGVKSSHGKLRVDDKNHVRVDGGTFPPGCVYTIEAAAPTFTALRVQILPESDDPATWPETGSVVSRLQLSALLPDGKTQRLEIRDVFADYLAGPYDVQQTMHNGAAGFGGYPKLSGPRWAVFVLDQPFDPPEGTKLIVQLNQDATTTGDRAVHIRHLVLSVSNVPDWTDIAVDEQRAMQWQQYDQLLGQLQQLKGPALPIMRQREFNAIRPTRLFVGGNWLDLGDVVSSALPEIFAPIDQANPDRLDLARWLVSDGNPLAARVLANRTWAQLFGRGIVESLGNFGSTGAKPTHPALLDHLAIRLREHFGWHIKPFLKELVLSATYRQSNRASSELRERDPANRLLARGPRIRLSAEMIRDQSLAVSGLLAARIGGPSVMPPQPEGVWKNVYSETEWTTPDGPDRYRRGLYTYWRRTSPYPSFLTFDAPTREFCTARRIPTNTPLQALITMNDPVYVECAQALGTRAADSAGPEIVDQIHWLYEAVTTQTPSTNASDGLGHLYRAAIRSYEQDPSDASNLASTAEQFARTVVASAIMNLDSSLNK